ncbi:MAG TPA: FCD domain-containing protein [Hyphomicrobiales bacterium]|nr:FCD domain-containing protein [Hyphomicrobiales bacterium]
MADSISLSRPSGAGETLAQQAYDALKADILSGEWPAGAALLTRDLLERYACGISPLREALARLVGEQFLEATNHRGVRVPLPSINDVEDVYRIRIALEREALALAIRHGDDVWEGAILAAGHRLERAPLPAATGDKKAAIEEWEARHRAFHTSLVSAAGAPRLLKFINQMVDQTERYRALRVAGANQAQIGRDIVAEHRELMEAVIARDPDCIDLLARHLDRTRLAIVALFRSGS